MFKSKEDQERAYRNVFESENGKMILEDFRNIFCVNPILVNTGDIRMDAYVKEGLRLAYQYIESNLTQERKGKL
jgi:hypothetical protein